MGQLADKVIGALKAVEQLQIVTAVGKVTVSKAFEPENRKIDIAPDHKAMVTVIHLAQGDVINGMDEAFAPGQDDALREFHERQVKLGNEIIDRNLKLLTDMAKEIVGIFNQEKDAGMP
ncbi:MAG: hypothetical protein JXK94_15825 [Deltaproteobacteria bacterium]|nr:hypothetical protein [Deltaproteobacteria bacterium]